MAIPEEVINEIKYKNDISDIISQYSVLKRRGKNLIYDKIVSVFVRVFSFFVNGV